MSNWFWISFAGEDRFLGGCVVHAKDATDAIKEASKRGLNPGGEAMVFESPDGTPGPYPIYELLSLEDMKMWDTANVVRVGAGAELEPDQMEPVKRATLVCEKHNLEIREIRG